MRANSESYNLIITGVGGQGNVLSSQLIGQALVRKGFFVTIGETYGASQRGGAVMSHVRISSKKQLSPLIPKGKADIVVALEPVEALRVLTIYGNPETVVIANTRPFYPIEVTSGNEKYPGEEEIKKTLESLSREVYYIPATEKAGQLGLPILANIIMIGALLESNLLPLRVEEFRQTLENNFRGERMEINLQALEEGRKIIWTERTKSFMINPEK
ncbi:MAG: indolepyruvate oxidoreductase subunit beta [Deltaproteobacteria bacterium]|nr:indolepyruvate oxidoreductase subunit beta [Deltaproteobacteria bacterium]